MALVGLLHGLGKLLAHPMWGNQPQWAVAGESFPVGCKFAPQISASEFFSANPDRYGRRGQHSAGPALGQDAVACMLASVAAAAVVWPTDSMAVSAAHGIQRQLVRTGLPMLTASRNSCARRLLLKH